MYNGQPSLIAKWFESLAIREGEHVLHIGCGTGYFTALLAHIVGAQGRVSAVDVDPDLAARAMANLRPWPWASAVAGDGRSGLPQDVDVVIVHAGATHVLDEWLDAVRDGGRLLMPLTGTMPAMGPIGKGTVINARRNGTEWSVRPGAMVAIYSLVGLRDAAMEAKVGQAFLGNKWMGISRIRRDVHEPGESCVVHGDRSCLSCYRQGGSRGHTSRAAREPAMRVRAAREPPLPPDCNLRSIRDRLDALDDDPIARRDTRDDFDAITRREPELNIPAVCATVLAGDHHVS